MNNVCNWKHTYRHISIVLWFFFFFYLLAAFWVFVFVFVFTLILIKWFLDLSSFSFSFSFSFFFFFFVTRVFSYSLNNAGYHTIVEIHGWICAKKAQSLTFDSSFRNGILLLHEVSKLACSVWVKDFISSNCCRFICL